MLPPRLPPTTARIWCLIGLPKPAS
jgi:hypothetical protein